MPGPFDSLSPEFRAQMEEEARKRQIAQAMLQSGFRGPQMPEKLGPQASRLSPIAALAPIIQAFMGQRMDKSAAERMSGIQRDADASTQKAISSIFEAQKGTPAVQGNNPSAFTPAQEGQPLNSQSEFLAKIMAGPDPRAAAFAKDYRDKLIKREEDEFKATQDRLKGFAGVAKDAGDYNSAASAFQSGKMPASPWQDPFKGGVQFGKDPEGNAFGATAKRSGETEFKFAPKPLSVTNVLPGKEAEMLLDANKEELKSGRARVRDAQSVLGNIARIVPELESGMKTGGLESYKQTVRKFAQGFGVQIPETGAVETVKNALAENIFAKAAALRPISNEEKSFLLQQVGSIDTDPRALSNILSWYGGNAIKAIQEFQGQHQTLRNGADPNLQRYYDSVAVGADMPQLAGPKWFQMQQIQRFKELGGDPSIFGLEKDATFDIRGPTVGLQKAPAGAARPEDMTDAEWRELQELRRRHKK